MNRPRLKGKAPTNVYHVICRTCQQLFLMDDPVIKDAFFAIIQRYAQVYYVEITAWVLMSNHYHLGLRVYHPEIDVADLQHRYTRLVSGQRRPKPWQEWRQEAFYARLTDLSSFMRDINREMAKWHNHYKKTTGHLWGARFKSIFTEKDRHELEVMSYIEHNPVRAGLAEKPSDYPWCSASRIKQALLKGESPLLPPIGPLAAFRDQDRAHAYVTLIDLLASTGANPGRVVFPTALAALPRGTATLVDLHHAMRERTPANWLDPIYGSDTFRKNVIKSQGSNKRKFRKRAPPAPESPPEMGS